MPGDFKGRLGVFFQNVLCLGVTYDSDSIRKNENDELKNLEATYNQFKISLDAEAKGLELPDLEVFQDDVQPPEIHWKLVPWPSY